MNSSSDRWLPCSGLLAGLDVLYRVGPSGLTYAVCPMPGYALKSAGFAIDYGGAWDWFGDNGTRRRIAPGAAHFLEHVLFKRNGVNFADLMSSRGADANAHTGLFSTACYFNCISGFRENLNDLMNMVLKAEVDPEVVEEERGIITAEHFEHLDSPYQLAAQALMASLFGTNNLTNPLTGTAGSLREMSVEHLSTIYREFYRPATMVFAVAGDIDPDECFEAVEAVAETCATGKPERKTMDLSESVNTQTVTIQDNVSRPIALAGWRVSIPAGSELQRRRTKLALSLALDALFSPVSELRQAMIDSGIADDSMTHSVESIPGGAFVIVASATDRPEAFFEGVVGAVEEASRHAELIEPLVEVLKKRMLGRTVALASSVSSVRSVIQKPRRGKVPPEAPFISVLQGLRPAEVAPTMAELLGGSKPALVVCLPRG